MKHVITITFEVDPNDYEEEVDTPQGAVDLVVEMLKGDADLPAVLEVSCGNVVKKVVG